jgi:hypothetical protein
MSIIYWEWKRALGETGGTVDMVHHLQEQWENVRGHSGKTCATISINETKFESEVSIDEVPDAWVARGEAHGVDAFGMSPVQELKMQSLESELPGQAT